MLKLSFQELQAPPTLTPGRDRRPSGAPLKTTAEAQPETSEPLCSKERQKTTRPPARGTAHCPGRERCSFLI